MLDRHSIISAAAVVLFSAVFNHAQAQFQPGDFITYSQENWGTTPSDGSTLLINQFGSRYPLGLVVGAASGFQMAFTDAAAVLNFLPQSGAAAPLNSDLLNPSSSASGVFGGAVVALQLNVDFNDSGQLPGTTSVLFGDLVLHDLTTTDAFNGLTVRQFLAEANLMLGAVSSPGPSYGDLAILTLDLSDAFESGTLTQLAQDHLRFPGDVNFDGVVDIFDVNLVSAHWGEAGPTADANGDGTVDIFDVNLISAHWTPSGASAVPEPSSILTAVLGLAVLGLTALAGRRTAARHSARPASQA